VFALACLADLLYATEREVPDALILLSALGLIAATVRTGVTLDALRRERAVARDARDEAERANQAKNEFLSRMSHELRTPLNAILGFGQLLELESLTAEQRSGVDHINSAGRHLLELINDVLDLARVESGDLRVTLEPVRTGDVLDEAVGLVTPLAAARDVRLPDRPATGSEQHVRADARRLRQVVLNLLANAVKYNREGGEVHVRTERTGDRVTIAVADTGAGIAAADLDRLFTPFDRLGAEHGTVEGTGLGLVLAQRMTEAMGGTIHVESTPGRGSTFRVELAAADAPARARTAVAEPPPVAAPMAAARTVLYVEDNRSNRLLVERMLARRADVTLLTAEGGTDGLELARRHRPDMILLDLHLADLAGEEFLRRLRADPVTAGLTVVVVSADATPTRRERLAGLGADGYVTKPFRLDALVALVTGGGGAVALPSPAGQHLIDDARIAELRELDDDGEALRTLSTAFLEDATDRVAEIAAAAAAEDAAEVQAAAHALMGAADTFGARRLGELAAATRQRARDGTLPDAAGVERLEGALEATRGAFARLPDD
jgi:signal transduction histidine kinase/CheY-like chemotaxis protein/HPt (histidine-containing phosphotransfer) domain-containing protein